MNNVVSAVVWWHTPVALALAKKKQKDPKFKVSLLWVSKLSAKKG